MFQILVAEDDQRLRQLFCKVLNKNGYRTFGAEDGQDALRIYENEYIDLLICDIMMPRMDGFELVRQMRIDGNNLPVLMITAKDSFQDKQQGFLLGIDDYMVKPVNVNEMSLRVQALLRRAQIIHDRRLTVGNTVFEYDSLTVWQDEQPTVLPQKEFYLVYKLIAFPNKIFTRMQLMDEIWGMDSESETRTVDVHINRLRERFKKNRDFEIVTVRGLGYRAVKKVE